jgi:hypothetical protein
MLKELLEVAADNNDITLDFIHSLDLEQFIRYWEYHYKAEKLASKPSEADQKKFDEDLLALVTADNKTHTRFLMNTDKLGTPGLLKLLVRRLSEKFKGKTVQQIREEWFVIKYEPLTPEQEHTMFETTDWLYPEVKPAEEDAK